MKRKISYLPTLVVTCMLVTLACNKADVQNMFKDSAANLQAQSDDQSRVAGEVDAVADDANVIFNNPSLDNSFGFNAPVSTDTTFSGIVCDGTVVVDTVSNPRTVTVNYNGTNCRGNRTRTGVVVLSMPKGMHWGDINAVLTISFQNLSIKRLSDNKSITLNGTHTVTNTSGGRLINLSNGTPIIHTITSENMSITFDDGRQRTWQVAKKRVFTYNNGVVVTTTGMHTDGTHDGIAEWGLNRFGFPFVSIISQPIVVRQDCSFRLVSGQVKHIRADVTTTATFGLDVNGNATGCPGTGNYYYKLTWTDAAGKTTTVILPY